MRIDHLAFRVANRKKTAQFLTKALGYRPCHRIPNGFRVDFPDKTYADCTVLVPPERKVSGMSWNYLVPIPPKIKVEKNGYQADQGDLQEYQIPPEIFISQGSQGSIVDRWVQKNGNKLHHIAIQVDNIEKVKNIIQDTKCQR